MNTVDKLWVMFTSGILAGIVVWGLTTTYFISKPFKTVSPKLIWGFEKDPNPALQFQCKYLNHDFRRCKNWEMVCTVSKIFGVHQCIILNAPKSLKGSKKK